MVRVGKVLLVAAATELCAAAAHLLALCLGRSPADVVAGLGSGGAAALKDTVTMAVNETLAPVRARRAECHFSLNLSVRGAADLRSDTWLVNCHRSWSLI